MIYIKVQIFDDKLLEGTEAFGVQLSIPNHHKANGVKLGDPSGVTVFIKDGMVHGRNIKLCAFNYCNR